MRTESKSSSKVMGPRGAGLIRSLYEADLQTFSVADAIRLSGVSEKAVRDALNRLLRAGVIARVKPGLYNIVPFELGNESDFLGSAPKIAVEIARRALPEGASFFLSHGTAMTMHQLVTQPLLTVYLTTPKQLRPVSTMGTEIKFISTKAEKCFGIENHWIDKSTAVPISDLERTVLDGLKQPNYCGGLIEVAKGFWMKRGELDLKKLVAYTKRIGVGAVASRLAYLLHLYQLGEPEILNQLREEFTSNYSLLDPDMPAEGRHDSRWQLRLNVTEEEFRSTIRT